MLTQTYTTKSTIRPRQASTKVSSREAVPDIQVDHFPLQSGNYSVTLEEKEPWAALPLHSA